MKDLFALFLHLLTTVAKLLGPGGTKAVLANLVKHQLLMRRPNPVVELRVDFFQPDYFSRLAAFWRRTKPVVRKYSIHLV